MNIFNPNKIQPTVKIGIWGPPGSGKTTYLIMLQFADCNGWKIKAVGKETQDIYLDGTERMRDKLEFVDATPVNDIRYLTFHFDSPKEILRTKRTFQVILPEAAGEHYEKPDTAPELLDQLSRYHGILWFVDPDQIDNPTKDRRSYRRMIQEWLFRLYDKQGGGDLKHYMAFCLTKMDLPNHAKYIDNPRDYCLDKLGADVEKFLENFCDHRKVAFFALSSIGFQHNTKQSNINPSNPSQLLQQANPINLFDPLDWLFCNL